MKIGRRQAIVAGAATLAACTAGAPSRSRLPMVRTDRRVERVLPGMRSRDGAGVSLVRHLGQPALPHLDPFVLLDEIQSSNPRDYIAGFPTHPHRGFETVTVMIEGAMRHRDSVGNSGLIVGGGAQWMTAGRGILHSEMPEAMTSPALWGFQLWVNLPNAERWRAPHYQDLRPDRLAEVALDRGGLLRVIAGEALGARGPVEIRETQPLLSTLSLRPGDDVEVAIEREHTAFVVVSEGEAEIAQTRVREDQLALLSAGDRVRIRAPERDATLLLIAGRPLREPFVHRGPFVMETEADIEQAYADYRAGRLGT